MCDFVGVSNFHAQPFPFYSLHHAAGEKAQCRNIIGLNLNDIYFMFGIIEVREGNMSLISFTVELNVRQT